MVVNSFKNLIVNLSQLFNIYINIFLYWFYKELSLYFFIIIEHWDLTNSLLFWVLIPDIFFIFILVYFLLYISFYNKYSLNLIFNQWVILYIIVFLLIELFLLIKLYSFHLIIIYFNNNFISNDFTIMIKIILIIILIFFFLSMYNNLNNENYLNVELSLIILISIIGMFWLISANDLISMFLALELQSLALYIICSIKKYSNLAVEAGLKYFILGSYTSAILAFGISLVYGFLGTTNYYEIFTCLYPNLTLNVAVILYFSTGCIFIGFLFKLGIVPFHLWIADVYEGSPNIITYFFAVVPKLAITAAFFRLFFFVFFQFILIFSNFILFCSLLSIFVGSVLALYQVKIKRFLAYSAIVHLGYVLLSISLGLYSSTFVAFFYLFVYILVSINIFTIFLTLYRDKGTPIKNIVEVSNIAHSNFFLALLFSLAILSVAGIPPLAGFFGKIYAFSFLVETGNYYIALFVVLISVLSCAYYIRLTRFILFREKNDKVPVLNYIYITEIQSLLLIFLFFINFFFLFMQSPIILTYENIFLSVWDL